MHEGESKKNSQQCVCVKPFVADISIVIDWRVPKYCRKKKQKQNKPCLLSLVCRAQESRIIELRNRSINKLTSVACTETEEVVFFWILHISLFRWWVNWYHYQFGVQSNRNIFFANAVNWRYSGIHETVAAEVAKHFSQNNSNENKCANKYA